MNHRFNKLKNWVTEHGGHVNPKIGIKTTGNAGRALYATANIEKDEIVIKIPDDLSINKNKLNTIPNIDPEKFISYETDSIIMIILLYHAFVLKNKSIYYTYIRMLPDLRSFDAHPFIQYNQETIKSWTKIGPKMVQVIEGLHDQYNKRRDEVKKSKIFTDDIVTEDNIKWAFLIIKTRQWKDHGLVPVADLMQHSNNSNMLLCFKDGFGMMTSNASITKDNLIYDNYGVFDDVSLFCTFGFIEGDLTAVVNGTDQCTRLVKVDLNATINTEKLIGRLKNNEMAQYKTQQSWNWFITNKGLCVSLLEYLRIAALSDSDIKILDFNIPKYYENVISLDNEARVFNWIRSLLISSDDEIHNKQMEFCREICKTYGIDTIEYKLACLYLIHENVTTTTNDILNKRWLNYVNIRKAGSGVSMGGSSPQ
jgi:hypothetical protein